MCSRQNAVQAAAVKYINKKGGGIGVDAHGFGRRRLCGK
jgi:hypothetical protein